MNSFNKSIFQNEVFYKLSDEEVLELYNSEIRIAVLMDLDVLCLIDHYLVVNLKEFITPKTRKLTAYAKRNLSACCVGIKYNYENTSSVKDLKGMSCTLDILIQSSGFLESSKPVVSYQSDKEFKEEADIINSEIKRLNGILNDLPGSFSGTLKKHMKRLGFSPDLLAESSWISPSTIKQYRQNENNKKTLKTVTALCIGLHLHPWLAEDMIRKAGLVVTATKQDSAYRYLYTFHYKDTIEECNKYLKSQNLSEFKMSEKEK